MLDNNTEAIIRALAAEYIQRLNTMLTDEQLKECRKLNGTDKFPIPFTCPTSQFCTNNELMRECFYDIVKSYPTPDTSHIWHSAERLARLKNYKN